VTPIWVRLPRPRSVCDPPLADAARADRTPAASLPLASPCRCPGRAPGPLSGTRPGRHVGLNGGEVPGQSRRWSSRSRLSPRATVWSKKARTRPLQRQGPGAGARRRRCPAQGADPSHRIEFVVCPVTPATTSSLGYPEAEAGQPGERTGPLRRRRAGSTVGDALPVSRHRFLGLQRPKEWRRGPSWDASSSSMSHETCRT
jgi:hypothetical protein